MIFVYEKKGILLTREEGKALASIVLSLYWVEEPAE